MAPSARSALTIAALCVAAGLIGGVAFVLPGADATDLPTSVTVSICGDAFVNSNEACDDGVGFNNGQYGSSTSERHCNADCTSFGPYCGDGILQVRFTEACDDGNNIAGDLCASACTTEIPVPPQGSGPPTVGAVPYNPSAPQGQIPAVSQTKVVLRGKAYPNANMKILLDGKEIGRTVADANADFLFSSTEVTPGTATFGFVAMEPDGSTSVSSSVVFEVLQGAVTTVANVFLPPTIVLGAMQLEPGSPLTISGRTVPKAKVTTQISGAGGSSLSADADTSGKWALQLDTAPLAKGAHAAKAYFQLSDTVKSGFGKAVSFTIGAVAGGAKSPDLNKDGKVNLVDFSIFLLSWNSADDEPDFNSDGAVNLADFSIMLFAWTG